MERKINIQLIGISVLAIAATTVLMLYIFNGLYREQVKDDLRTTAGALRDSGIFQEGYTGSYHFNTEELRVTWIAADGTVLYDNDADESDMENHAGRPEVVAAFASGSGESVRRSETLNKSTFYYALRLEDGTVLRVAKDEGNLWSIVGNVVPIMAVVLLVMMGLCVILARVMTRGIVGPIEEMTVNLDDYSAVPAYRELIPFVKRIRAQHEDILKAAKMRQDFTANVSHELKTPLTAISGYAELMENGMVEEGEAARFSGKIRQNADRLLALINDILRLSEMDSLEGETSMEMLDLAGICGRCVDSLKMYAEKQGVTLTFSGGPAPVRGNGDLLYELAENLCNNAVRYNRENGRVEVETGVREGHAFLRVADTGIGIPEEHQSHVFERFYRVDRSRSRETGGTGLGLAIVKHVAALHGAQIILKSEAGRGTEISVTF